MHESYYQKIRSKICRPAKFWARKFIFSKNFTNNHNLWREGNVWSDFQELSNLFGWDIHLTCSRILSKKNKTSNSNESVTPKIYIFLAYIFEFLIFLNWDSLHARLNSHYEAWSYKKSTKKITEYRKSV